jgi:iron complex transport system substrate-binding protein
VNRVTRPTSRLLAVLLAFGLAAAACGSSSSDATGAEEAEADNNPAENSSDEASADADADASQADSSSDEGSVDEVESTEEEMRIVAISPTATEMLFAIGAGDLVVAADSFSNYPADAPTTDISAFEPSLEAIAAFDPDYVVMSYDPSDIVAGLEQLGIIAVVMPAAASLDDVYGQIADLGIATGHEDEAASLVAEIRSGIDEVVAGVDTSAPPIRVYHEIDDTFYSATTSSFIGQLYGLLGVENIADAADPDNASFGYPQLSPEYLIEADPQLIVITDQVGYDADAVAARPGWDVISAVQNDGIVQVDADIASRWGPRIVEFLEVMSEAVEAQMANA